MKTRILALALVTGLSACATPTPPAAVVTYSASGCRAAPDLATAIPFPPPKKKAGTVRTAVDATTPCLDINGSKTPYVVYTMPAVAPLVEVGGAIEQVRVFPPSVSILGEDGATVRTFTPAQYHNRGDRYSVQFVPQAGERYILVTVDQSLVGTTYEAVTTGVSATYAGTMTWISGVDQVLARSRSYHGAVVATAFEAPREARR